MTEGVSEVTNPSLTGCRLGFEQAPACGSGLATDPGPTATASRLRESGTMEGVANGPSSRDAAGGSVRAGRSKRRVLLSRVRCRPCAIRLRKAGEGLLLSILQHEADAVGSLAVSYQREVLNVPWGSELYLPEQALPKPGSSQDSRSCLTPQLRSKSRCGTSSKAGHSSILVSGFPLINHPQQVGFGRGREQA